MHEGFVGVGLDSCSSSMLGEGVWRNKENKEGLWACNTEQG